MRLSHVRPVLLSEFNAMVDVIMYSKPLHLRQGYGEHSHQEKRKRCSAELVNQHSFVCSSCVGFVHGTLPLRWRMTAVARMKRK
jgi:hypothetical protein